MQGPEITRIGQSRMTRRVQVGGRRRPATCQALSGLAALGWVAGLVEEGAEQAAQSSSSEGFPWGGPAGRGPRFSDQDLRDIRSPQDGRYTSGGSENVPSGRWHLS